MLDQIYSYRDMCDLEEAQTLQRGMNFRIRPTYSVILMSQRSNAPYVDRVYPDGVTIEYEGHDVSKRSRDHTHNPKDEDQPAKLPSGHLTQNGLFVQAVQKFKKGEAPELVKVYEKIIPGFWSLKGFFDLIDYKIVHDGVRDVYRFTLRLSERVVSNFDTIQPDIKHTRLIPSQVKIEVWKRDEGKRVICGDTKNLHYDHELPFSKGGTSLSVKNIRLLCMKHNLQKSGKIE